jgi:hypothetical protein
METKVSEHWVVPQVLTEQDVRRLIAEKLERARLLQLAQENRKLADKEIA